jgi:hypothetical protein
MFAPLSLVFFPLESPVIKLVILFEAWRDEKELGFGVMTNQSIHETTRSIITKEYPLTGILLAATFL